jgi:uncharacterized membrane protein YfcA
MDAFGRAFKRLLAGYLGAWCIVGLFMAIASWPDLSLFAVMLILVALSYAFVIWIYWKQGLAGLKWFGVSMLGCFAFSLGGAAVAGIFAAFTGIELYNRPWFSVVVSLLGFWIVERRQKPETKQEKEKP